MTNPTLREALEGLVDAHDKGGPPPPPDDQHSRP